MEFRNDQPIYLQIADFICEQVLLNKWTPDNKIPSIRELAVDIEVNPNTVMRTYTYLQDREIIYNRRGIGFFIAVEALKKAREIKLADFRTNDLPRLFHAMSILDISMDDLAGYYQQYQQN